MQPAGAFKIRGAYNMLAQLSAEARGAGVITYSSGNHGQAMALAARLLGIRAVVVMPETAPRVKVEGAERLGAEVIFAGTTVLDRKARAESEAAARGLTMVPPFDHPWIIAGQGTCGLEILEQSPCALSAVYVPMGGGGLISGVAVAVKSLRPACASIGVEPEGAPKMTASRAAGHPVTLPKTASIADGLLSIRPGDLTFAHVQALVDDVVTVSEREIAGGREMAVRPCERRRRAERRRQRRRGAAPASLPSTAYGRDRLGRKCRARGLREVHHRASAQREHEPPCFFDSCLDGRDLAVELFFVDLLQDFADARAWREAQRQQVSAEQQRRRRPMFDAERARALDEPVHRRAVEVPGPPEAVGAREAREQLEIDLLREPAERAVGDVRGLVERARLQVMRDESDDLCRGRRSRRCVWTFRRSSSASVGSTPACS